MTFLRKLRWLFERKSKEAELQEEIAFHLEEEAEARRAAGQSDDAARGAARQDLGNVTLVKEDTRAAWSWTLFEQFLQDMRYSLRAMMANKAFTALVIVSLALGIGANTAIFSFMDSILLRSLPVPNPESLVSLAWHAHGSSFGGTNRHDDSYRDANGEFVGGFFPYPVLEFFRRDDSVFTSVFGYQGTGNVTLSAEGRSDDVEGEFVTGNFFDGLGVIPAAGRLLSPQDDTPANAAVAVISFAASKKRFGDPARAVGRDIKINNIAFTVVGVTPADFFGTDPTTEPSLYVPMQSTLLLEPDAELKNANFDWLIPMARLRPGVTAVQAQTRLATAFTDWEREVRGNRRPDRLRTLVVNEAAGGLGGLRRQYQEPLVMIQVLVALILTIACANIANLLLARGASRSREIAVRLGMGASRARIIRQLLSESLVLAMLGGAAGLGVAYWSIRSLTFLFAYGDENFTFRAHLNLTVLGGAFLLSLAAGVLFGLIPALRATRLDLIQSLKSSKTGDSHTRFFSGLKLRQTLAVLQIVLTLVILVAAGLFVRTFTKLSSINLGFNPDNVLTFSVNARQAGHSDPEIVSFYDNLRTEFAAIPGVTNAAISNRPMIGQGTGASGVKVEGAAPKGSSAISIGPGFFRTMQIPIRRGRDIDERDRPGTPKVAVVNKAFVKQLVGDKDPIGLHVELPRVCAKCYIELIGVAADTHYGSQRRVMPPMIYLAYPQSVWGPINGVYYQLRTAGPTGPVVARVREILQKADQRIPLADLRMQRARIDNLIGQEIALARLCTAFAILALTISCIGLYGTISYNVARKTSEIGIRMALGAQRRQVVRMVLAEVMWVLIVGLAISIPTAMMATGLVKSFLFGIEPNDPLSLVAAGAVLVIAAILAGYLPARHASRIDPLSALRHE